jgi:holliday junction DNA helicase RuvA
MICRLTGRVYSKDLNWVDVDVSGVGYMVGMATSEIEKIHKGDEVTVSVYEHIREDAHDLYGFLSASTRELFVKLHSVNGVGPKMALSILGLGNNDGIRAAIASGDAKYLQSASGVGKKVAERIIVDLKDKIGLIASSGALDFLSGPSLGDEAVQALVALGYSAQDAGFALSKVDTTLSLEERVKAALMRRGM